MSAAWLETKSEVEVFTFKYSEMPLWSEHLIWMTEGQIQGSAKLDLQSSAS